MMLLWPSVLLPHGDGTAVMLASLSRDISERISVNWRFIF